jgi:hypothetical protein
MGTTGSQIVAALLICIVGTAVLVADMVQELRRTKPAQAQRRTQTPPEDPRGEPTPLSLVKVERAAPRIVRPRRHA